MGLLFRGIVWFGLYLLLAGLPLFTALFVDPFHRPRPLVLELSVGAGLVAFALMSLQFALVGRIKSASAPFGTDALMQFHRQLGMAAVAFALLHPLLLTSRPPGIAAWNPFAGGEVTRSGAIALWSALLILVTSVFRRRLRLPFEAWNILHLVGALVVVGAMLYHVLAVSGYARAGVMRWLLAGYAVLVVLLVLRYRVVRPVLLSRRPWEVVANRDEGGDTRTLRLRPVGHGGLGFEPGQFAWLITGRSPMWGQQHPLSLSSSAERPDNGPLEFSVKALGDWSSRSVPALADGDRVWVDGAYGVFTPDRVPGQGFVLIAGGIGISPFRSILLTLRDRGDRRPVHLIYAAHDMSRTVFERELEVLRAEMDLTIVYVFEEPDAGWRGERGFVNRDLIERHLPGQYRHFQFFVCGPVAMNDAVERMLLEVGISAERIHTERFNMV